MKTAETNELFPVIDLSSLAVEETAGAEILPPEQDPANEALGGVLARYSLEPLASPCCPLPLRVYASEAARLTPGVLAAKITENGDLLVRYEPDQIDPLTIASEVNQASFLVELVDDPVE